jgi:hypothetical protein
MLSDNDREIIETYTETRPTERYQEVPKHAFKGFHAFDLYSRLGLNHRDGWLESFTDYQKNECFLLVTIQTTISKAVLKNPSLTPITLQRRVRLYFRIDGNMHPSAAAYTSTTGQKWLKILLSEPNNLI